MAGRKKLSAEDQALWDWVVRDVAPVSGRKSAVPAHETPVRASKTAPVKQSPKAAEPQKTTKNQGVQGKIDRRTGRKLGRGDLPIDARIDLHGRTQTEAHSALIRFITSARARGVRVALVITGKGTGGDGVLRRAVPLWLESGDLAPHVLQYAQARPNHGGAGALYVLLRKS